MTMLAHNCNFGNFGLYYWRPHAGLVYNSDGAPGLISVLPASSIGVYAALQIKSDGKKSTLHQADLAELTGMSEPTVRKGADGLDECGLTFRIKHKTCYYKSYYETHFSHFAAPSGPYGMSFDKYVIEDRIWAKLSPATQNIYFVALAFSNRSDVLSWERWPRQSESAPVGSRKVHHP